LARSQGEEDGTRQYELEVRDFMDEETKPVQDPAHGGA
jgi:hypothetical protein